MPSPDQLNALANVWVVVTGFPAIVLVNLNVRAASRIGAWLGLASQPGYFYSTYHTQSWGLFAMCFAFTGAWLLGLYTSRKRICEDLL